jgi:hypothetical protein
VCVFSVLLCAPHWLWSSHTHFSHNDGAKQLYKEHILLEYKQPVNMDTLNLLLSIFQFIIASVLAPLIFGLQGLGGSTDTNNNANKLSSWMDLYPSSAFSENFSDGMKCFLTFGQLSADDQANKYPEPASCQFSYTLVLLHVWSIILVGWAVDKIVNAAATKLLYRGISAGIIISVLSMNIYDLHLPDFNYGPVIDTLNLGCLILLILGSEVYHRVTLPNSTFETEYQRIENLYD